MPETGSSARYNGPSKVVIDSLERAANVSIMAVIYKLRNLENGHPYIILPGLAVAGRNDDSNIVLDDSSISRAHARFHNTEDGLWIEDLNSCNGTYVRDRRVSNEPVLLSQGEIFRMGTISFRIDPETKPHDGRNIVVQKSPEAAQVPKERRERRTNRLTDEELSPARHAATEAVPSVPQMKPPAPPARATQASPLKPLPKDIPKAPPKELPRKAESTPVVPVPPKAEVTVKMAPWGLTVAMAFGSGIAIGLLVGYFLF